MFKKIHDDHIKKIKINIVSLWNKNFADQTYEYFTELKVMKKDILFSIIIKIMFKVKTDVGHKIWILQLK